ncbi:MAG TPA: hypothetical protein DCL77_10380 [Prolixibacteraceae bacterium]|jgi:hypothetical protein|nr:hypothetical protein [Prolixibacteraceae bacterium]
MKLNFNTEDMNKSNPDQLFSQLLHADQVGKPDPGIEDRLMYAYLLKSRTSKPRQNSFSSFFGWLLSFQNLWLKTGLVTLVLFFSLMNNQLSLAPGSINASDSLYTQRGLLADTTNCIQPFDSIRADSLN